MNRGYLPMVALFAFAALSAKAKGADFDINSLLNSSQKRAIILLDVQGLVSSSGRTATNHGSGFFIDKTGLALTAAHIFFEQSRIDSQGRINQGSDVALLQGHIGSSGSAANKFDLIKIDTQMDIALIGLVDPPDDQKYLDICTRLPSIDDNLFALGFPGGQPLSAPSGHRLGNRVGNKYPVQIDINPGMSGGPVLDANGKVFGISVSGIRDDGFQGYNFVLPLSFAKDMFQSASVSDDCAPDHRAEEKKALLLQYGAILREINRELIVKNGDLYPEIERYRFDPSNENWNKIKSTLSGLLDSINDGIKKAQAFDAQFVTDGDQVWQLTDSVVRVVDSSYSNRFEEAITVWNGKEDVIKLILKTETRPKADELEDFQKRLEDIGQRLSVELTKLAAKLEAS